MYGSSSNSNINNLTAALASLSAINANASYNYTTSATSSWLGNAPFNAPYSAITSNTCSNYPTTDSIHDRHIPERVLDIIMNESTSVSSFNQLKTNVKLMCWAYRRGEVFHIKSSSILKLLQSKSKDTEVLHKVLHQIQQDILWDSNRRSYESDNDISRVCRDDPDTAFNSDANININTYHLKDPWWRRFDNAHNVNDEWFVNNWKGGYNLDLYLTDRRVATVLEKVFGIRCKFITSTSSYCSYNNPYIIANRYSPEWRDTVIKWIPEEFFKKYEIGKLKDSEKDSIAAALARAGYSPTIQQGVLGVSAVPSIQGGGLGLMGGTGNYYYDSSSGGYNDVDSALSQVKYSCSNASRGLLLVGAEVVNEDRLVMSKVKYEL